MRDYTKPRRRRFSGDKRMCAAGQLETTLGNAEALPQTALFAWPQDGATRGSLQTLVRYLIEGREAVHSSYPSRQRFGGGRFSLAAIR
jgi:hypothetical protein